MLRIRFRRVGKKHQPSYRLVVSEQTKTPIARSTDDIGWYNPHSKEAGINEERAKHWLSVGAQPSTTVHNLFVKEGIIEGKKIRTHSQPKKSEEEIEAEKKAAEEAAKPLGHSPATGESKEEAPADAPAEADASADAPAEEKPAAEEAPAEEAKEEPAKEEAPAEEKAEEPAKEEAK